MNAQRFTRLDKLRLRLEAQNACLDWAFGEIAGRPGPVFELGLGHGPKCRQILRNLDENNGFRSIIVI